VNKGAKGGRGKSPTRNNPISKVDAFWSPLATQLFLDSEGGRGETKSRLRADQTEKKRSGNHHRNDWTLSAMWSGWVFIKRKIEGAYLNICQNLAGQKREGKGSCTKKKGKISILKAGIGSGAGRPEKE